MNFTETERILKSKIGLQGTNPFFAYILLHFNIHEAKNKNIPTMAVDAFGNLYWNEDFVKKLSDDELKAVLSHEAMHVATLTFKREGSRDHNIWNIATDLAINTLLTADGFTLPKECILANKNDEYEFTGKDKKKFVIKKVSTLTAEEIYDELIDNAEIIKCHLSMDGDGNYDGSIDQHMPGEGKSEEDAECGGEDSSIEDQNANAEKWKKVTTEAATAAKMRGKSSAWMDRMVDGLLNPEVNWKAKLQQFITRELPSDFTMRRPGRRYYTTGVYYPTVLRENLDLTIAVDTSGSIGQKEYAKFLTEIVSICKSFPQIHARLIYWSTECTNDLTITSGTEADDLVNYKFGSTGGTEMSCVARYCTKENISSQAYIFLTDGEIESNPQVPDGKLLFVLSKHGSDKIVKKYGEVCKLRLDD